MANLRRLQERLQQERTVALVINAHAQHGRRRALAVQDGLAARGFTVVRTALVDGHQQVRSAVEAAVRRGVPLVVVGGGDGTLTAAMDAFADREVVLGIVPLGTGNSFARTLGIPLTVAGALDLLVHGHVAAVDLGQLNAHYFANVVTVGFPADAARTTSPRLKRLVGPLAYGLSALRQLLSRQAFWCQLDLDGHVVRVRTHQVVVANGSFLGARRIPAGTDVEGRRLVVSVLAAASRWQLVRLWARWLLGQSAASAHEWVVRVQHVGVETVPPQVVSVDGEVGPACPVECRVAPEALAVLVPRTFADR